MADLLFSLNAVMPLFLVMLLGFILKQRGFLNDAFVEIGTKICFNVALPCLLFLNILGSNLTESFDLPLTLLCVGGTVVFVLLLRLLVPHFIPEKATYTTFIQVSFRSNYALIGLPFVNNIAGQAGMVKASTVLAFVIVTFNILAVLVLIENQSQDNRSTGKHLMLKRIATNPLIIAAVLGIIGSLLQVSLPALLERPLGYIADMAMPLSLFTLGASISHRGERQKLRLALASSGIKLVALPLAAVAIAWALHFDTVQLSVVLALFAGPPAVSCFPMAFQMGADYQFTSLAVVTGTTLAALTMFLFVFCMRIIGLL